MALKQPRDVQSTLVNLTFDDIYLDAASQAPGAIVVYGKEGDTAGTPTAGKCHVAHAPSGFIPAGMLLSRVVDIDETTQHRNFHKDEQVLGEKVNVMNRGWAWTTFVTGSPVTGDKAYLTADGVVTKTKTNLAATPYVGEFQSEKDSDNYIKLFVSCPNSANA